MRFEVSFTSKFNICPDDPNLAPPNGNIKWISYVEHDNSILYRSQADEIVFFFDRDGISLWWG